LKTLYGDEGGGHRIHMRGLPFRATEEDIADVRIAILINRYARFFSAVMNNLFDPNEIHQVIRHA